MTSEISIRTLKDQVSRVLRGVREEDQEYVVTYHGKPVAVIRPFTDADRPLLRPAMIAEELEALEQLGREIQAAWISDQSPVELVEEQRR